MRKPRKIALIPVIIPKNFNLILSLLRNSDVDLAVYDKPESNLISDRDLIIILGRDRDFLELYQRMERNSTPVLGISPPGEIGFLTDVTAEDALHALNLVLEGKYFIEDCLRISISIDGNQKFYALNEVALFPSKSAILMEYKLTIDEKFIWRDYCDGVIIATPVGSTAYAMSAGGPFIMANAEVVSVVSVNSMDLTRRPLIVPADSKILIDEISCRFRCEAIIDGIYRESVKRFLEVKRAKNKAKIVRLNLDSSIGGKIFKKIRLAEELMKMPPSAKLVLKTIQQYGPITQKDIVLKSMLPPRTVRYALSVLLSKNLVKKRPLVRDARQNVYYLNEEL